MTFIDAWQVISNGGALGLAIVFLWLFKSGRVRTEKQLTEAVDVYKEVIAEKNTELTWWRTAYQQQVQRGDSQEVLNRENMELAKTALAVLNGVQSAAKKASS